MAGCQTFLFKPQNLHHSIDPKQFQYLLVGIDPCTSFLFQRLLHFTQGFFMDKDWTRLRQWLGGTALDKACSATHWFDLFHNGRAIKLFGIKTQFRIYFSRYHYAKFTRLSKFGGDGNNLLHPVARIQHACMYLCSLSSGYKAFERAACGFASDLQVL